jgi:hypothetical protein
MPPRRSWRARFSAAASPRPLAAASCPPPSGVPARRDASSTATATSRTAAALVAAAARAIVHAAPRAAPGCEGLGTRVLLRAGRRASCHSRGDATPESRPHGACRAVRNSHEHAGTQWRASRGALDAGLRLDGNLLRSRPTPPTLTTREGRYCSSSRFRSASACPGRTCAIKPSMAPRFPCAGEVAVVPLTAAAAASCAQRSVGASPCPSEDRPPRLGGPLRVSTAASRRIARRASFDHSARRRAALRTRRDARDSAATAVTVLRVAEEGEGRWRHGWRGRSRWSRAPGRASAPPRRGCWGARARASP